MHTTNRIKNASGGNGALAGDAGGELAEGVHCGSDFELKQTKADYALSRGVFANMRELSAFAPSFLAEIGEMTITPLPNARLDSPAAMRKSPRRRA